MITNKKEIRAAMYTAYDKKSIDEIEKIADRSCQLSKESRKKFIEVLYYLQFTSRFRENKLYKKASFKDYIYDQFHLRETSYHNEKAAFFQFPDEAVTIGPGVITKARQKCGALKVKKVLAEIVKLPKQTPEKINKIIFAHAKPVKPKPTKPDAKQLGLISDRAVEVAKQKTIEAESLKTQVLKLKDTVKNQKIEIAALKAQVAKFESIRDAATLIYNYVDGKTVVDEVRA